MRRRFLIFVLAILVFSAAFTYIRSSVLDKASSPRNISSSVLENLARSPEVTLINVHTPYEGEIVGTDMFIEYDSIMANKLRLPVDKNARLVLYCKTGPMSEQAMDTLLSLGYMNVSHLPGGMEAWTASGREIIDLSTIPGDVLPETGVSLPIEWGDIGPKLTTAGVIDMAKFEKVMQLTDKQRQILTQSTDEKVFINGTESRFIVNVLWALGLAQKSLVYTEGPMGTTYKDSVGNFASTGGWTLSRGEAVSYLNRYNFIPLTEEHHRKVMEIADNVYRPCCGNSTAFPDCNHGMAALAAIEMMVSAGFSDDEIYRNVLVLNSYWFPDTYLNIATKFGREGVDWHNVDAKTVLGQKYSSGQAAGALAKEVGPLPYGGISEGGSCGA